MIEIVIQMFSLSVLFYIATKISLLDDVCHEIRDSLKGKPPEGCAESMMRNKHNDCKGAVQMSLTPL